jgi:mercuric ion binding protein
MMKKLIVFIWLSLFSITTWAELKSVTLAVPGMDCPVCPVTVRKALEKVEGVDEIIVEYETRTVVVAYDDTRVGPTALMQATTNAGFPSTVSGK